jgi:PhnB protein
MNIDPYLTFNGNCGEAFRFYEKVLGGKIEMMMTYDQAPPEAGTVSPGSEKRIMHVRLSVGGQIIMGSDAPPQHFTPMGGFSVSLAPDSRDKAEKTFKALSEGGKVMMPFQKTFWAEGFGMVVDRFGTPWMVNYAGNVSVA